MLVFHSHCQLGNQMFIYACAHSLAKAKNLEYCLSEIGYLKYFNLSKEDYQKNNFKYLLFRFSNKFKSYSFQHLQDNRVDYHNIILKNNKKKTWYYGYFQGENYFYGNESEVKKRFSVKKNYVNKFKKLKSQVVRNSKYAIVHIRLKDYKTFGPTFLNGPDLSLPFEYYHKLIKEFQKILKLFFYQMISKK